MSGSPGSTFRFGVFEFDASARELRRQGRRLKLSGQPVEVLAVFLENAGRIVSREELRKRLWPENTFVDFDHSLNTAINKLREVLGDSASEPRFIETLPRRGYRFIASVESEAPAATAGSIPAGASFAAEAPHLQTKPKPQPPWAWMAAFLALVGAVLGLRIAERGPAFVEPRRIISRPLTSNPQELRLTAAAVSPDGVYLAFADVSGLYLRRVETSETYPLPLPEAGRVVRLSWFPDSSRLLAITWERPEATLWSVTLPGGTARKLRDGVVAAAVSPDGSHIAFVEGKGENEIWLTDAQGEDPRRVVATDAQKGFVSLAWSPDARRLAFHRYVFALDRFNAAIETVDVQTGQTRTLVEDRKLAGVPEPGLSWLPDGRLIFALGEPPPNFADSNLWEIRVNSKTGEPSGTPRRVTDWAGFSFSQVSASADGRKASFLRVGYQPDVYIARLDRGRSKLSEIARLTQDGRSDVPTAWTPDGKSVLFHTNRNGNWDIFRQDIDSRLADPLVTGPDDEVLPRLAPDGKSVLYWAVPKSDVGSPWLSRTSRVMRVSLEGGLPEKIFDWEAPTNFACGVRAGTRCVVGRYGKSEYFFQEFDPQTGLGKQLAKMEYGPWSKVHWQISPDGSRLAAMNKIGAPIILIDLERGGTRELRLDEWSCIGGIDWAEDGEHLIVGADSATGAALLRVDLEGGVRVLHRWPATQWGLHGIPSPDGRRMALAVDTATESNAWLVERY